LTRATSDEKLNLMASRTCSAVLALALVVAIDSPAEATVTEALSLRELVASASHVALVTCEGERTSWDDRRRIVTDFSLRVEEVMKGSAAVGGTLTMRRLGGVIGDLGMRIEGEPALTHGTRYLVFLRSFGGVLRPVGMSQGVLRVRAHAGAWIVEPGGGGLALVHRVHGGQLQPAPGALLHPLPLDRVRTRVTSLAGRP